MPLDPKPTSDCRLNISKQIRENAALIAAERLEDSVQPQTNNGEANTVHPPVASFTKSLRHDGHGFVSGTAFDTLLHELSQPDSSTKYAPFPNTYDIQRRAEFGIDLAPKNQYIGARSEDNLDKSPRPYESPLGGHIYDLEGLDADALGMPPAPALGSDELVAEMAEVYAMALLRDVPLNEFETGHGTASGAGGFTASDAVTALNALPWFGGTVDAGDHGDFNLREEKRRVARTGDGAPLTLQTLFRGSTPGARVGPYLSQFLLIGNASRGGSNNDAARSRTLAGSESPPRFGETVIFAQSAQQGMQLSPMFVPKSTREALAPDRKPEEVCGDSDTRTAHCEGFIQYGQQTISQQIIPHRPCEDFMQSWTDWLDVQNGLAANGRVRFHTDEDKEGIPRFLHTPRDLATYVHYDALYQAYLNACLWLLGQEAQFDAGLPEGAGHPTRDAFATFGGPHILTLVTEVATRALKAVRRQKFQVHLRARPEAIGGALTLASSSARPHKHEGKLVNFYENADRMLAELAKAVALKDGLHRYNGSKLGDGGGGADVAWLNDQKTKSWLLPMAFPEGSPTHGSYGAGHATVAGACTTVLKAFFEMFTVCGGEPGNLYRAKRPEGGGVPDIGKSLTEMVEAGAVNLFPSETLLTDVGPGAKRLRGIYRTGDDGRVLCSAPDTDGLTLQGELDKLAANISIARNFAGVHYYTDYYESLRLGERIAVGLLQEQMLTYREPVSMRLTSFDGDRIMITGTGGSYHGKQPGGYDRNDAQVLVWPAGDDAPDWTNVASSDEQKRDAAIHQEAAKWWNRAMIEAQ